MAASPELFVRSLNPVGASPLGANGREDSATAVAARAARSPGTRLMSALRRGGVGARQPLAIGELVVFGVIAMIAIIAGAPPVALWAAVTGLGVHFVIIGIHAASPSRVDRLYGPLGPPLQIEVSPDEIDSTELRVAYTTVLRAHRDIRNALQRAEHVHDLLRPPYRRCGDLVQLAGRVARVGNTLQAFLREQDPALLATDVANFEGRSQRAADEQARHAYHQAATVRSRQLANYRQILGFHDRILARLELIAVSLESFQALIAKLDALALEQIAFAGESISEGLDVLRDDLEVLESAMDEALSISDQPIRPHNPPDIPSLRRPLG